MFCLVHSSRGTEVASWTPRLCQARACLFLPANLHLFFLNDLNVTLDTCLHAAWTHLCIALDNSPSHVIFMSTARLQTLTPAWGVFGQRRCRPFVNDPQYNWSRWYGFDSRGTEIRAKSQVLSRSGLAWRQRRRPRWGPAREFRYTPPPLYQTRRF